MGFLFTNDKRQPLIAVAHSFLSSRHPYAFWSRAALRTLIAHGAMIEIGENVMQQSRPGHTNLNALGAGSISVGRSMSVIGPSQPRGPPTNPN